ncbi:hypothetical protein M409DRAFT_65228 [Zasmidium cellare ATCC 36951]|uniref:gamma-glutamylcyclotransferase n=1 Tax=Zasmidium cellare ATCC 36951 TaxID=1080233 RepID=A0A6A6CSV8_ZASCE|nr:uncharacterized protein M409DRAFT_65228 [Zasmidium cellare ATCC 36951]KAF2168859.1 hypothetical protein M409DRAFT_65228 [Zasmidium cellare ATCC 36951]
MESRSLASAYSFEHAIRSTTTNQQGSVNSPPPQPSTSRLQSSLKERPFCVKQFVKEAATKPHKETVLYLAYGSNLANEKFRKDRKVNPLSQINVQVPSLRLVFDLPGIPYSEPCFANTARRDPYHDPPQYATTKTSEKTALLGDASRQKREKSWTKGLIGVVYEVTPQDYAHIIATEGGGSGYQDILVDCHPFVSSDPNDPVPSEPILPPFKAHTLFAPAVPEDGSPPKRGHRVRPDPDFSQPSARYLKLITDGAAECKLPYEYQGYLLSLHPFTITSTRQRIGQYAFLAVWMPLVLLVFTVSRLFADKNGIVPKWIAKLVNSIFEAAWASYDYVFKPTFGEGERTVGDDDGSDNEDIVENDRKLRRAAPDAEVEKGVL